MIEAVIGIIGLVWVSIEDVKTGYVTMKKLYATIGTQIIFVGAAVFLGIYPMISLIRMAVFAVFFTVLGYVFYRQGYWKSGDIAGLTVLGVSAATIRPDLIMAMLLIFGMTYAYVWEKVFEIGAVQMMFGKPNIRFFPGLTLALYHAVLVAI